VRRDYVFLRRLENRIQALRDQQTHRLPSGEDLDRVTRAMGEQSPNALARRLSGVRRQVSTRFEEIFPTRPALKESNRWMEQWHTLQADQQDIDPDATRSIPPAVANFLRRLDRFVLSQRARRRLDQFMPVLLKRIDRRSPDQETLDRVFDLVLAICQRSVYLALLVQNLPALDRMLDLFSRSEWIATKVIRFPALLDELIDPSLGRQIPAETGLARSVERLLKTAQGTEAMLEGLNYLKLATALRIAVAQIQGVITAEQGQQALSGLAEAVLKGVLEIAGIEVEAKHGRFPADGSGPAETARHIGDMAIIAYGTLGATELGYNSDLDIVFLFRAEDGMSDGLRPLPPERYYARLAQRILSFLTVMTRSGRLYDVDTRLRPNGRAGALVSSIGAFRNYQLNEAWTWELQALTRARFIAGNTALKDRFDSIRREVLCRSREEDKLRADLLDMRDKMSREYAANVHVDTISSLKYQSGGLIDIEFIAQLGVLSLAGSHPQVVQATGTLGQIAQLQSTGWLSREEADLLCDTMQQLRQHRMMASLLCSTSSTILETKDTALLFEEKVASGRTGTT
jgi:glutamate-ammonia-ligase adenylyltransferase